MSSSRPRGHHNTNVWRRPVERFIDGTVQEHDLYGGGSVTDRGDKHSWSDFSSPQGRYSHRPAVHRRNFVCYRCARAHPPSPLPSSTTTEQRQFCNMTSPCLIKSEWSSTIYVSSRSHHSCSRPLLFLVPSFYSRGDRSAWKGSYVLRNVSQHSPKGCLGNVTIDGLVGHKSFPSSEMKRQSLLFLFFFRPGGHTSDYLARSCSGSL